MIDLGVPRERAFERRTDEGHDERPESELVAAIRECKRAGDETGVRALCEILLRRSTPVLERCTLGLSQRPELREDAIAAIGEQLLRQAMDSRELFLEQNYIHALRCLCADVFKQVLRQEGLHYRRDTNGMPQGRPQRIPQVFRVPLRPESDGEGTVCDVLDPEDPYEQLHAREECQRILSYLDDPLDRTIVVLRAIEGWQWKEIAAVCRRSGRSVRGRYSRAREYLCTHIISEAGQSDGARG